MGCAQLDVRKLAIPLTRGLWLHTCQGCVCPDENCDAFDFVVFQPSEQRADVLVQITDSEAEDDPNNDEKDHHDLEYGLI